MTLPEIHNGRISALSRAHVNCNLWPMWRSQRGNHYWFLTWPWCHKGSHKRPADLLIASLWLMITPPFPTFTSHLGVWDKLTWPLVSCDHWTNYHGDDTQSWVTASPPGSSQSRTITRLFIITFLHKLKILFFWLQCLHAILWFHSLSSYVLLKLLLHTVPNFEQLIPTWP